MGYPKIKRDFATIVSKSSTAQTTVFEIQGGEPVYVSGILFTRNVWTAAVNPAIVEMRDSSDNILGEIVVPVVNSGLGPIVLNIPFYAANGLRFEITGAGVSVDIVVFHSQAGA